MTERASFAAFFSAVTVFSTLWTFAPISRFLSKVLGMTDNGLTYDRLYTLFLNETVPRAVALSFLVALILFFRETRPTLAWLGAILVFPITFTLDFVLQVSQ